MSSSLIFCNRTLVISLNSLAYAVLSIKYFCIVNFYSGRHQSFSWAAKSVFTPLITSISQQLRPPFEWALIQSLFGHCGAPFLFPYTTSVKRISSIPPIHHGFSVRLVLLNVLKLGLIRALNFNKVTSSIVKCPHAV